MQVPTEVPDKIEPFKVHGPLMSWYETTPVPLPPLVVRLVVWPGPIEEGLPET
jgi:hypothetical protein